MDVGSAFVLGLVQGVTEFLPISSSGHLVIGQRLLGWKEPQILFDVCLHVGTLSAVLIVFRKDLLQLAGAAVDLIRRRSDSGLGETHDARRALLLVLVGSIPTGLIGVFAHEQLERLFASINAVAINLIATGAILWLTRIIRPHFRRPAGGTRWRDALWVGTAQGLAIMPGVSRSGTTISVGLIIGLDREWAGRFSFLLFIPAIMGALLLEVLKLEPGPLDWLPIVVGTATAALTGYGALRLLLGTVKRGQIHLFGPYCWVVGAAILIWSLRAGW